MPIRGPTEPLLEDRERRKRILTVMDHFGERRSIHRNQVRERDARRGRTRLPQPRLKSHATDRTRRNDPFLARHSLEETRDCRVVDGLGSNEIVEAGTVRGI
jgi:hypothetical protein